MANSKVNLLQRKMTFSLVLVIFVLVTSGVFAALKLIFANRGWERTVGTIEVSRIEEEYHNPTSKRAEVRMLNYHFLVVYRFPVSGQTFRGERVMPVLPTIFSRKDRAEEMMAQFPVGKNVSVYFRPDNPGNACLIPNPLIGKAAALVVALVAGLAATSVLSLIWWMRAQEAATGM